MSGKKSWIKDDTNEDSVVLDLLSSKVNILTFNPEKHETNSNTKDFPISKDGKLIIGDLFENRNNKRKRANSDESDNEIISNNEEDKLSKLSKQTKQTSKSKSSKYEHGGKGIHRQINKEWGQEYKSAKASGDMKRKGKPDPYAYIPIDNRILNRRKRAKLSGQYNSIVRSARKGAVKGSKEKIKRFRN
jgi:ribosomal RNA-processing protein 12